MRKELLFLGLNRSSCSAARDYNSGKVVAVAKSEAIRFADDLPVFTRRLAFTKEIPVKVLNVARNRGGGSLYGAPRPLSPIRIVFKQGILSTRSACILPKLCKR